MAEIDPSRRAVVTGLGAVMPIGNDFETYWRNLRAGVTGTRPIVGFDASAYEVRIAAEVLDFDPASAMDPKMARRMSRFVALSMAAGPFAAVAAAHGDEVPEAPTVLALLLGWRFDPTIWVPLLASLGAYAWLVRREIGRAHV